MRMPAVGLPRPSISAFTRSAASGVTDMTCGRGRRTLGGELGAAAAGLGASVVVGVLMTLLLRGLVLDVLLGRLRAIVGDRRLDRVLGQHRAMDLHRRQRQV